ncbi:signal peptidase II [Chloroflexota bacterium]
MQKAEPPRGKWGSVVFFLIALLIVAADQISKVWIRSNLAFGESLPATGLLRLTHIHNTGAAFGLFQGQSFPLTIVSIISIAAILLFAFRFSRHLPFLNKWTGRLALGLVLGGTIGNLIDRLYLGYVTDFIYIGIWPAFNIADSAITVGVIVFACFLLSAVGAKKY